MRAFDIEIQKGEILNLAFATIISRLGDITKFTISEELDKTDISIKFSGTFLEEVSAFTSGHLHEYRINQRGEINAQV